MRSVQELVASRVSGVAGQLRCRRQDDPLASKPCHPLRALTCVVLVATSLVGCSGSTQPGAAPSGAAPSGPAPSGSAPSSSGQTGELETFCARAEQFNQTLATIDASKVESFDVVASEVEGLARLAPPELAGDLMVMSGYWARLASIDVDDAAGVGTLGQRSPEEVDSGQRVTAYLVDECGIAPVE